MINLNMFDLYFKKCIAIYNDHEADVEVSKEDQKRLETGMGANPFSKYKADWLNFMRNFSIEYFMNYDEVEEAVKNFRENISYSDDNKNLFAIIFSISHSLSPEAVYKELLNKNLSKLREYCRLNKISDEEKLYIGEILKTVKQNDGFKKLKCEELFPSILNKDEELKSSEEIFGFNFVLYDSLVKSIKDYKSARGELIRIFRKVNNENLYNSLKQEIMEFVLNVEEKASNVYFNSGIGYGRLHVQELRGVFQMLNELKETVDIAKVKCFNLADDINNGKI